MTKYVSIRYIDGKVRNVIIDETGNIINNRPNKEELKSLEEESRKPYDTKKRHPKYCDICKNKGIETELVTGKTCREYNKEGNWTGNWLCKSCYDKYMQKRPDSQNNIIKSLRYCRTGNITYLNHIIGDNSQELACILYGWEDLNKKYDNYKTPIDCYDPKTGLYHQVKGSYYYTEGKFWPFTGFEREWKKIFEDMICFCFSEDGKIVERIYKFPWKEIMRVKGISVRKDPTDSHGNSIISQFEKYRIDDKNELKKADKVWNRIQNFNEVIQYAIR